MCRVYEAGTCAGVTAALRFLRILSECESMMDLRQGLVLSTTGMIRSSSFCSVSTGVCGRVAIGIDMLTR